MFPSGYFTSRFFTSTYFTGTVSGPVNANEFYVLELLGFNDALSNTLIAAYTNKLVAKFGVV